MYSSLGLELKKTCSDFNSNYGFLFFCATFGREEKIFTDEEKNGKKDKSEKKTDNIADAPEKMQEEAAAAAKKSAQTFQ